MVISSWLLFSFCSRGEALIRLKVDISFFLDLIYYLSLVA